MPLAALGFKTLGMFLLWSLSLSCWLESEYDSDLTLQCGDMPRGWQTHKMHEPESQNAYVQQSHLSNLDCPSRDGFVRENEMSLFFKPLYFAVSLLQHLSLC